VDLLYSYVADLVQVVPMQGISHQYQKRIKKIAVHISIVSLYILIVRKRQTILETDQISRGIFPANELTHLQLGFGV
jgi:hypothetical protein